jgi:hypothetical protein
MHTKKPVAALGAAAMAFELAVTDPEHRKLPHAHGEEYVNPRPVGQFSIEWQSTASSFVAPMTFSIGSSGAQAWPSVGLFTMSS